MAAGADSNRVEEFTKKACKVYNDCSLVPTLSAARISAARDGGARYEVEARWTQRELLRGKKLSWTKSYFLTEKEGKVEKLCSTGFQADATRILKVSQASDAPVKAVLVKDKPAKAESGSEPQQYIEVWSDDVLVKTIEVKSLKAHGKIHENIFFGAFHLSPNGKQLLYVAEKKKPKGVSYFSKAEKSETDDVQQGVEYVFEPNWGEQLTDVELPVPVVLQLDTEECTVVDVSKAGDVSAAQARWVPGDDGGLTFVGYENRPRKLGFVYCLNRRSALYYANVNTSEITQLTDNTRAIYSPSFNPQGDKLVYLDALANGPHRTCAALKMITWPTKAITTVVDVVHRPAPGTFPGLYLVFLPDRCWDSQGKRVFFSDSWGSLQEVVCVDVENGSVTNMTGEGPKGAWSVMDVSHDLMVASYASLNTAPKLYVGALPSGSGGHISWTEIASIETSVTRGLSWEVFQFTPPEEGALTYEAILLTPDTSSSSSLPPLVVGPHGGPHGAFVSDFMVWPVCMAALGFAVLLVNFRGSTGYGQDSIFSLPGNIGTQDVDDVQRAAKEIVEKGLVDKEHVVAIGGSHGGFLSTHLVAQFPDFYQAASVRNPVVNIPDARGTADIPDWAQVEAGFPYDACKTPTAEQLTKMLSVSPVALAEKIKAPTIIHVGTDDLRVSPLQGKQLYYILKALGKTTKLLLYPGDSHPINSVPLDSDSFVNTVVWLYQYGVCT